MKRPLSFLGQMTPQSLAPSSAPSSQCEHQQLSAHWPFVSVIIPIYNGEADLPDLIAGLWAQTYPAHRVEYLLVNNRSGDRTAEILQQKARESRDRHITLTPLQADSIQSSYAARNVGIRAAQGEILAFTDADCRPHAAWLEELIKPFSKKTVGLVAGEITGLPGHTLLERFADRQDTLSQRHTLAHPFCPYGQTANLAICREVIESVGLFRPYLTTGGDADLCWRILCSTPWSIEWAQQAIVQHRHRSTWPELRSQWRRYGRSNRYLHELHGVDLAPALSWRDYGYRVARWLLKEVPRHSLKMMRGESDRIDLLSTPISLICIAARSHGQRSAQLPPNAEWIEPWQSPIFSSSESSTSDMSRAGCDTSKPSNPQK